MAQKVESIGKSDDLDMADEIYHTGTILQLHEL